MSPSPEPMSSSLKKSACPRLKMLRPLCNQTVNLETDAKTLHNLQFTEKRNQMNRIFYQKNLQTDQSFFASYGTQAMNYFASLGIFMRQRGRMQGNKITEPLCYLS